MATPCTSCGVSIDKCDELLESRGAPCCGTCHLSSTHDDPVGGYEERLAARRAAGEIVNGIGPTGANDLAEVVHLPAAEAGPALDPEALSLAMTAAAQRSSAVPGIPDEREFERMCQIARLFSASGLAPAALKGKPFDALIILMTGRDLGIPMTTAFNKIAVIDGKASIEVELQLALVRQNGLGAVLPLPMNDEQEQPLTAGAVAVGPDGSVLGPPSYFTWDDAREAGYVGAECWPGAHAVKTQQRTNRRDGSKYSVTTCDCKDNWQKSPRDMLWWRAAARCRRRYFPEAGTGLYDASELGAVIDVEGRIIDPAAVDLPDGYEDPQAARQAQQKAQDAPCTSDQLWALQERIEALPTPVRNEMREAWKENERLAPYAPRCVSPGESRRPLPQRLHTLAKNMLNGWDSKARQLDKTWDRDAARHMVREELADHLFVEVIGSMFPPPREEAQKAATPAESAPEAPGEPEAPAPAEEAEQDVERDVERDWGPELREAAAAVGVAGAEVSDAMRSTIAADIAGMHWATLNKALEAEGISTEGPIDLRRMRLTERRYHQYEEPF